MNRTFLSLIVLLSVAVFCIPLPAQTPVTVTYSQLPYFEGFENADTVGKYWKLNAVVADLPTLANKLTDRWCMSQQEHYSGNGSLLVSATDDGRYAVQGKKASRNVAYCEFDLPAGDYDLSFAWRCHGERMKDVPDKGGGTTQTTEAQGDGLWVGWTTEKAVWSGTDGSGTLPTAVLTSQQEFKGDKLSFSGSQFWKTENYTVRAKVAGKYRLYFVWNNDGDNYVYAPSACIDNIQLAPAATTAGACVKPDNFSCSVSGLDATLTWTGTAPEYEVRYREYGATDYKSTLPVITPGDPSGTTTITIKDIKEGLYDFFVRAICAPGDTSMWVVCPEQLFYDYQAEGRCINFTDLDAAELRAAKVFAPGEVVDYDNLTYNVVTRQEMDFGFHTGQSRITVHNHPGEVDRRADGKLKTIPPGEVMSVRLGTWNDDGDPYGNGQGQGQKITYDYTVPTTGGAQILLLNYALVLQIPLDGQHEERDENGNLHNMPHFTVELYEVRNGQEFLLDPDCNSANFYADYKYLDQPNTPWRSVYNRSTGLLEIVYRDWTPVGFDLSKYQGKQLRIRFATYDCRPQGHYAYAYFTLRCIDATGVGMMCGNENKATLEAPYGFEYEWYRPSDAATVASTDRIFVDNAPELGRYTCKLKNTQTGCVTDFFMELKPRQPKADFTYKPVPNTECINRYEFTDISKVMIDGVVSAEEPEYTEFDLGEYGIRSEDKFTIDFPAGGDTIDVPVRAQINKGTCPHDTTIQVRIPSILVERETLDVATCTNLLPYKFKDADGRTHEFYESDTVEIKTKNVFGCELTTLLRLAVSDVDSVAHFDTICEGETCEFNGQEYYRTGSYRGGRYTSASGCDSIPWLHLFVREKVVWQPQLPAEICADDEEIVIPYSLVRGAVEAVGCRVEFDQKALDAGFLNIADIELADSVVVIPLSDGVRPDHYSAQVIFTTDHCGDYPQQLDFTVAYPTSVMQQKWNDVITLKNAGSNGGYTFSAYQWYRNGAEIPGAGMSYIYVGADGTLGTADSYSVLLTREGENYTVPTCALVPEERTPLSEYPQLSASPAPAQAAQRIELVGLPGTDEPLTARWYTTTGVLVATSPIADDNTVAAPSLAGVYLLHIAYTDRMEVLKVVVK